MNIVTLVAPAKIWIESATIGSVSIPSASMTYDSLFSMKLWSFRHLLTENVCPSMENMKLARAQFVSRGSLQRTICKAYGRRRLISSGNGNWKENKLLYTIHVHCLPGAIRHTDHGQRRSWIGGGSSCQTNFKLHFNRFAKVSST